MTCGKYYLTIYWGFCLQCDGFHKSKVKLVLKSFWRQKLWLVKNNLFIIVKVSQRFSIYSFRDNRSCYNLLFILLTCVVLRDEMQ